MTRIDHAGPRCPMRCKDLACLLAVALAFGAIGSPGERALAAEDARQIFEILDDDGNGRVTREEFLRMKTEIFYRALKDLDRDQRLGPEEINVTPEAFTEADLNGDGKISGAEFVQARFTQFEAIDANGDQEITFEELQQFLRQYQL